MSNPFKPTLKRMFKDEAVRFAVVSDHHDDARDYTFVASQLPDAKQFNAKNIFIEVTRDAQKDIDAYLATGNEQNLQNVLSNVMQPAVKEGMATLLRQARHENVQVYGMDLGRNQFSKKFLDNLETVDRIGNQLGIDFSKPITDAQFTQLENNKEFVAANNFLLEEREKHNPLIADYVADIMTHKNKRGENAIVIAGDTHFNLFNDLNELLAAKHMGKTAYVLTTPVEDANEFRVLSDAENKAANKDRTGQEKKEMPAFTVAVAPAAELIRRFGLQTKASAAEPVKPEPPIPEVPPTVSPVPLSPPEVPPDTNFSAKKVAVTREELLPLFMEPSDSPAFAVLSDEERYAAMAKKLADASGITKTFGDKAKIEITDEAINIDFDKGAMDTLPVGARDTATKQLASVLSQKLKEADAPLMGPIGHGSTSSNGVVIGSDIYLPLNTDVDMMEAAIDRFKEAQKANPDAIIQEMVTKAQADQPKINADLLFKALGAEGSMFTTSSAEPTTFTMRLTEGKKAEEVVAALNPIFKKEFGAEFLSVSDKPVGGTGKTVAVDLAAIARYDAEHPDKPLKTRLAEIQPQINPVVGIVAPAPAAAAAPPTPPAPATPNAGAPAKPPLRPTPKSFKDVIAQNKSMGILATVGAVIGWAIGGRVGAFVGGILGGGAGAVVDGKTGVLGVDVLGTAPAKTMTPKLQKAVTAYANARFADPATGAVDPEKVKQFVTRYENIVAKNMKPEDQDKRADEIKDKIVEAAGKAQPDDMQRAMNEAMAAMKITDKGLIQLAGNVPPTGIPLLNAESVKKAAQSFRS